MTSRRTLLLGCAAALVGGAAVSGRFDHVVRAVGLGPRRSPSAADVALMAEVRDETRQLLALAATANPDIGAALREQLASLGDTTEGIEQTAGDLRGALKVAATRRAAQAVQAHSAELMQVLASMAAGLATLEVLT